METTMRIITLSLGLLAVLTLAACQGGGPIVPKDRSVNDTGRYGGQKGNFHTT